MVRHICMFKLKEEAEGRGKEEIIKEALERLEGLREISLIRRFEVVTNADTAPAGNYDLSLIFDFENMDDLYEYQKEPRHVEFGNFITGVRENRACIDYEF